MIKQVPHVIWSRNEVSQRRETGKATFDERTSNSDKPALFRLNPRLLK